MATGTAIIVCLAVAWAPPVHGQKAQGGREARVGNEKVETKGLPDILDYIAKSWESLRRSLTDCRMYADEDIKSEQKAVLYLPAKFPIPAEVKNLQQGCQVEIRHLPEPIQKLADPVESRVEPPGLLYLPNAYIVPGGRFNEMYGWDSYFIIRGLLDAGKIALARGIVENFFFEIEHYGAVLNANRTYYLTRSQPPFLSSMILAVYDREKAAGREDRAWIEKAYPPAVENYELWTRKAHLAGETGLSRYYDFGKGPGEEVVEGTPRYYHYIAEYFLEHPKEGGRYLVRGKNLEETGKGPGKRSPVYVCEGAKDPEAQNCPARERVGLSEEFYEGDRSMRESGFDVTFRFGPFGADTQNYAPVGLNSLLYKTEKNLEEMCTQMGHIKEAKQWAERAATRKKEIDRYMWDEERGMYFDYDFVKKKRSSYEFATTFYPLWVGAASAEQAKAVEQNLGKFLKPGGLLTSLHESGVQWDYPYGWAPLQLIAAEGLRRYGFNEQADQLSYDFLTTVLRNFRRDGTIREKYNVVTGSSEFNVEAGYKKNVVGFGWTNGVFLALLRELPDAWRKRIEEE